MAEYQAKIIQVSYYENIGSSNSKGGLSCATPGKVQ